MADYAKTPAIRFAGFTDAWEQRKLGEIYKVNNERNDGKYPVTKTLSIATMNFNEQGNGAAEDSIAKYKVLCVGDIAFEGHTNKEFRYGRFVLNNKENGIMSPRFTTLRPIIQQDYTFWEYYIHSERVMRSKLVNATKAGTMMNELVPEDLFRQDILVPSLSEQSQIGAFLKSLDNLITLHQRKGNQREKKSLDFAWEQRKLEEIVDVRSGRDYKHLSEGSIPVYGTGGYMLSVNEALSYDEDAIGIGRKGTIDKPYVLKAPFWTVDTLFYAVPSKNVDLDFAFCIFQNVDWKKKDESTGVPSLSKTAINSIDVITPPFKEQQEIGRFFRSLDDLITLHQREHKSNFRRKTNVKQSTRDRPFLLLLCSVDKGLQRGSGP